MAGKLFDRLEREKNTFVVVSRRTKESMRWFRTRVASTLKTVNSN